VLRAISAASRVADQKDAALLRLLVHEFSDGIPPPLGPAAVVARAPGADDRRAASCINSGQAERYQ
jgi:hypothetical protein